MTRKMSIIKAAWFLKRTGLLILTLPLVIGILMAIGKEIGSSMIGSSEATSAVIFTLNGILYLGVVFYSKPLGFWRKFICWSIALITYLVARLGLTWALKITPAIHDLSEMIAFLTGLAVQIYLEITWRRRVKDKGARISSNP